MSNRFSDRLTQLSQARSALSSVQVLIIPLLNDENIGRFELIGDALANIETDLKAASDTIEAAKLAADPAPGDGPL